VYLEIDEGFLEHPKTLQLCASMEDELAFGYLLHFWRWACRSCKDGDLRGMSIYAIEKAARYHAHDAKLFAAFSAKLGDRHGFVEVDDSGKPIRIHNWHKRTGAAIARMEAEAEYKRMQRAHKAGKCEQGCPLCAKEAAGQKDVGGVSGGHPGDVSTQTSPVQTSPAWGSLTPRVGPASKPGRPAPAQVLSLFSSIRAKTCATTALFFQPPQSALDKTAVWLAEMDEDGVKDIEGAITKACEHVRDGADDWTHPSMRDPNFLWGTIIARWSALREELHGVAPPVAKPKSAQRAEQNAEREEAVKNWRPKNAQ
jgi:hypothetical protein